MQDLRRDTRPFPLAEVAGGEQVEVVEILFETIRRLCPPSGLHRGDILDCEGRTSCAITLRRPDGTRVTIDPFYASFVAIRPHSSRNTGSVGEITPRERYPA